MEICVVGNGQVFLEISNNNATVEFHFPNMRPQDGNEPIYVDNIHIGRTEYLGDGSLVLKKTIADNVIVDLFIKGWFVGNGDWESIPLSGFSSAYRHCRFEDDFAVPDPAPPSEYAIGQNAEPIDENCFDGPPETQARCQCEQQQFEIGTREFVICFESVLARMHRQEQLDAEESIRRRQTIEADAQRQEQAQTEQSDRRRKAFGALLYGIGRGLVEQPSAPVVMPPTSQRCTSRWVGGNLVTRCF